MAPPLPARTRPVARIWGTRGSIPSPGPATARFGGNTPCVEVLLGGERIILDAGSGIRRLGRELVDSGEPVEATVLLTHFHWDHIQGFPFFYPLYDRESRLRIVGPRQGEVDVESLFAGQMGPLYFPVPFSRIAAATHFQHLNEGTLQVGEVEVRAFRVCHPSFTVGYRLAWEGHALAYIPDNELLGERGPLGEDWRGRLVDFLAGAEVLIHDAMYTEGEYPTRQGWGHSTFRQALELAHEAGVPRLVFFHHDPDRTDDDLAGITERARTYTREEGIPVEVCAAEEGAEVVF